MELAVAVRERGLGQDTVPQLADQGEGGRGGSRDGVIDQLGQRRRRCEAKRSHHLFVVDQFGLNGPHFYSNGRV